MQLTITIDNRQALFMEKQVRRLNYGDALVCEGRGSLEYIEPETGFPHYIFWRDERGDNEDQDEQPVGVQYVRASSWLREVQQKLGAYLVLLGFTPWNCEVIRGGAITPAAFEHNRLPHLFAFDFQHQQPDDEDDEDWADDAPGLTSANGEVLPDTIKWMVRATI